MRITELLNKDAMDLHAAPKSKAEAIDLLVDLMVRSGNRGRRCDPTRKDKGGSTGRPGGDRGT